METKYCPLRHIHCLDAGCAWWCDLINECSIKVIAKNSIPDIEWHYLTEDTGSYPEVHRYVLVEDECGDQNIAYCDANCDWFIDNGEETLQLHMSTIIKWKET